MGTAPVGTAVFVGDAPFSNVNIVDSGVGTQEAQFFFDPSSFASVGTSTYGTSSNPDAPGAGDLWERDQNGVWSLAIDSPDNEAQVAIIGSEVFVATGSVNGLITVRYMNTAPSASATAANGFATIGTIDSAVPSALVGYKGEMWFGAGDSAIDGGQALLFHGAANAQGIFDQAQIPVSVVGTNVYQRVTDLATITSVNSGVTNQFLVVAVGAFDQGGNPLAGSVLLSDGTDFEIMNTWRDDAPMAIGIADRTIYVGTRTGLLQYRDDNGDWIDEPGLPANNGIYSLVVNNGELVIGSATATGASVFLRSGGGTAPPPPPPPPQDVFFTDVEPILANRCASCHGNGAMGLPAAQIAWELSSPTDSQADFDSIVNNTPISRVNLADPAQSQILLKSTNDASVPGGHVGGQVITVGDADYTTIETWISQGARLSNVLPTTYVADVHPMLQADCGLAACHGAAGGQGGPPGFEINADAAATYTQAVMRVDMMTPEASLILVKPSQNGVTHGGLTPVGYGQGEAKYNTLLKWISDGALQ